MKNFKLGLLGAFAFAVMLFAGCEDACKDVTCLNGGTCLEGICQCTAGYEGTDCGTAYNAKFQGTYNQSASLCDTVSLNVHPIAVTPDASNPSKITVGGLYENPVGTTVSATIDAANTNMFTIDDNETFVDSGPGNPTLRITGTGTLSDDGTTLTVTYSLFNVSANQNWDGCTDSFLRQ